jgi:hypothetical protein|tara:strand:+ start:3352 stop:4230 length:879 start_codon:yes stop_codon:yes gene_type:complete
MSEENKQVDNPNEGLEPNKGLESTGDDFFEALDRDVNPILFDPEEDIVKEAISNQTEKTVTPQEEASVSDQSDESQDYETLQKRYSDSSREAKRLHNRVQELEPYLPVLDAMREDPNLISHVRNYFEGGGNSQGIKEKLGLSEDFMFDTDEAYSNPESDSAKVMTAAVDSIVQRRLSQFAGQQKQTNERNASEVDFREKHEMSDTEFQSVMDFAKSHTLGLEDVYYLMRRGERDTKIAESARQEVANQMRNVRSKPSSASYVGGSSEPEKGQNDLVFDSLLGIDRELENAFS